jgi:hypothetical protein
VERRTSRPAHRAPNRRQERSALSASTGSAHGQSRGSRPSCVVRRNRLRALPGSMPTTVWALELRTDRAIGAAGDYLDKLLRSRGCVIFTTRDRAVCHTSARCASSWGTGRCCWRRRVVVVDEGRWLLQRRVDDGLWGLIGGSSGARRVLRGRRPA